MRVNRLVLTQFVLIMNYLEHLKDAACENEEAIHGYVSSGTYTEFHSE